MATGAAKPAPVLGYERIEMQFVSDLFVPCQACEGKRFKPEILEIQFEGRSIADILELDVDAAVEFFFQHPKVVRLLKPLVAVGLGYLKLGQPLNTLSGGESQRLKLVRYLGKVADKSGHALILIDEPTTGLHRSDVKRLIGVLQGLVDAGHSLIVIEHNIDMLKVADWIVEMGPGAGSGGGRVVAEGPPQKMAETKCETATYLRTAFSEIKNGVKPAATASALPLAAESAARYNAQESGKLTVIGAREHDLKNVSCGIPHDRIKDGSPGLRIGQSSLAFDIIFAEGQRRFMESMSAYARQFVEQRPVARMSIKCAASLRPSRSSNA